MAIDKVRAFFRSHGLEHRIREFDESSATVELAAKAVNCEPKMIAKTLSFKIDDHAILVVTSGDAKIDNAKYRARFGVKAKMLSPDEAETLIGQSVGGICPFAIEADIPVYFDISMKRFLTVFPGAGSSNSVVELSIEEFEKLAAPKDWVDVCKNWSRD